MRRVRRGPQPSRGPAPVQPFDGSAGNAVAACRPGGYEKIASTPGAASVAAGTGTAPPIASSGCPAGVSK